MSTSNDDVLRAVEALHERFDSIDARLDAQSSRIGDVAEGVLVVLTRVVRLEEQASVVVKALWEHRHGPHGEVEV